MAPDDGEPPELSDFVAALENYQGRTLELKQARSLKTNLTARGFDCGRLSGYDCLKKLSRLNVKRILGDFSVKSALAQNPEIASVYEKLSTWRLRTIHNSHHLDHKTSIPIFSSDQLLSLGLRGGRNTGGFSEWLGGADQVFFFADFMSPQTPDDLARMKSPYGGKVASLLEDYARERAWVSPFIMTEDEFSEAARAIKGWNWYLRAIDKTKDSNLTRNWKVFAKQALDQLDFTVSDFEELNRALVIQKLVQLKKTRPAEFRLALQGFALSERELKLRANQGILAAYAKVMSYSSPGGYFTFGSRSNLSWEVKVPVAVPPEGVQIFSGSGR